MRTHCLLPVMIIFPLLVMSQKGGIDTRVDQMRYWMRLAAEGKIPYNPDHPVPKALPLKSIVTPWGQLSPDVRMGDEEGTHSENSVTVFPGEPYEFHGSNNASDWPVTWLFGSDAMASDDGGEFWEGEMEGAGGDNNGDPAIDADLEGRLYSGRIAKNNGQAVAWSDDRGVTWHEVQVASPSFSSDLFDKNHLCVDRCFSSPFEGRVYVAWTYFGPGADDGHVFLSYSADRGLSWSVPSKISGAMSDVFLQHGVNLRTAPNGDVYAVWSLYDNWPGDESAIVFTRSTDGGVTFEPARRVGPPVRGNRVSLSPKRMRLNSFPVMAVDCSEGPYKGNITVVWSNKGIPGQNLGNNTDIWCIGSTDRGDSWSDPVQVSHNTAPEPHTSFLPWLCADEVTGHLFTIFYDDRNTDTLSCEAWVAASFDCGSTWMEFPVSDVSFTPQPIAGMAASYFGDYIGITSYNDYVCPVWTDNRNGIAASWCSPFKAAVPEQPYSLTIRRWWLTGGSSSGHVLSTGDTSQLNMTIVNTGTETFYINNIQVRSESQFVDVQSPSGFSAVLMPGDSVQVGQAARIFAQGYAPDHHPAEMAVTITGSDTVALQDIFPRFSSPDLVLAWETLSSESVTPNGIPDAGENFVITFFVVNKGGLAFPPGEVQLESLPQGVLFSPASVALEAIPAGDTLSFSVNVSWPVNADTGSRYIIRAACVAHPFSDTLSAVFRTSSILEDWESGTLTALPWSNTPDYPWRIDSVQPLAGRYSLRSATPPDNGRSVLSLSYYVAADDSISFWLKTESELNYDMLTFRIGSTDQATWSGRTGWKRVSFPVDSGYRVFSWIYSKDIFNGLWSDCAWLDDIRLPAVAPAWLQMPDTAVCHTDSSVVLVARGGRFNRLRWFSQGDGTLSYLPGLQIKYTPGMADREAGVVTLTGLTIGNLNQVTDTMNLFIQQPPSVPSVDLYPSSFCPNITDSVTLSSPPLPFHTLRWFVPDSAGVVAAGFSARIAAPAETQVYRAVLANFCGISDTATVGAQVLPLPSLTLPADSSVCYGSTTVIQASGDFVRAGWSNGDSGRVTLIGYRQIPEGGLNLSVTVQNEAGCEAADTVVISLADCYTPDFGKVLLVPGRAAQSLLIHCNGCSRRFVKIEVYNASGQVVYKSDIAEPVFYEMTVPFINQTGGVYLFRLFDDDGQIVNGKFFW